MTEQAEPLVFDAPRELVLGRPVEGSTDELDVRVRYSGLDVVLEVGGAFKAQSPHHARERAVSELLRLLGLGVDGWLSPFDVNVEGEVVEVGMVPPLSFAETRGALSLTFETRGQFDRWLSRVVEAFDFDLPETLRLCRERIATDARERVAAWILERTGGEEPITPDEQARAEGYRSGADDAISAFSGVDPLEDFEKSSTSARLLYIRGALVEELGTDGSISDVELVRMLSKASRDGRERRRQDEASRRLASLREALLAKTGQPHFTSDEALVSKLDELLDEGGDQ